MSTPDNRSVNFLVCFVRDEHYSKTWPLENDLARSLSKSRYQDDALCDPFYCRRSPYLLSAGRLPLGGSAWAGSCHCPVRLNVYPCRDCGGWASVLSRHYPLQSLTGFMKFAVNCRSLDRCWHPLKASLITRH